MSIDSTRNHNVHTPQLLPLPVKQNVQIAAHSIVATESSGLAVPADDGVGLTVQGVAWKGFDNTGGESGTFGTSSNRFDAARLVQVDQVGEWEFEVAGASPRPGQTAFVVSDNLVSAEATTHSLVLGRFTRPGNEGGWFVDVERR